MSEASESQLHPAWRRSGDKGEDADDEFSPVGHVRRLITLNNCLDKKSCEFHPVFEKYMSEVGITLKPVPSTGYWSE